MPTNYIENHEKIQDIPKEYKKYWNDLINVEEAQKYDSSKANYYTNLSIEH